MIHPANHRVEIITRTIFGHGDSETIIKAICLDCEAESDVIHQLLWPPTKENMREALTNLQNKPER